MDEELYLTDREELAMVNQQLISFSALLAALPLGKLVNTLNRMDSVGPIIDPTLWRKNMQNIDDSRRIAEAALTYVNVFRMVVAEEGKRRAQN